MTIATEEILNQTCDRPSLQKLPSASAYHVDCEANLKVIMSQEQPSDRINDCRERLNQEDDSTKLPFELAWNCIDRGNFTDAVSILSKLDGKARFLANTLIELAAARKGASDAQLTQLCEALHNTSKVSAKTIEFSRAIDLLWCAEVGARLSPETILTRQKYHYLTYHLQHLVVRTLCKNNRHKTALSHALQFELLNRRTEAELWARIALGLSGEERDRVLEQAASIGNLRPMIQDGGGEEAEAHSAVLELFARHGLSSEHPATKSAGDGLLELAKEEPPKYIGWATCQAAVAAALAAADRKDEGWYRWATQLHEWIFQKKYKKQSTAALALAAVALGFASEAGLNDIARSLTAKPFNDAKAVLRAIAVREWEEEDTAEELVQLSRQGVDVKDRMEAFLDREEKYGFPQVKRFIRGCRLCLSDERLEQLLAEASYSPGALVQGAVYGFSDEPERKRHYLARGYPEGDRYGVYTENVLLPYLSLEMMAKGERFYSEQGVTKGLSSLALKHFLEGRIHNAARAISSIKES
ncbi:MAG: hypothetical protein AAGA60_16600 [Cyanobacteria bacterium P01_E01_bin.42]